MARMPRLFASLARSMASIDRGVPSGAECACMSIAPVSVCAGDDAATARSRTGSATGICFIECWTPTAPYSVAARKRYGRGTELLLRFRSCADHVVFDHNVLVVLLANVLVKLPARYPFA